MEAGIRINMAESEDGSVNAGLCRGVSARARTRVEAALHSFLNDPFGSQFVLGIARPRNLL